MVSASDELASGPILMSAELTRRTKIFSRMIFASLMFFCAGVVFGWLKGTHESLTVFYGAVVAVILLFAWLDEERFKLMLFEDCIVRLGILRRRIPYIAIIRVVVNPNRSIIESADARIAVNRGVERRDQVMCEIIKHIQSKSGAEIVGDLETISKYKSGVY